MSAFDVDEKDGLPQVLGSPSEKGCWATDIIHSYSTITSCVEPKFSEEPIIRVLTAYFKYERDRTNFELTMAV
jgi:hypothetical protein